MVAQLQIREIGGRLFRPLKAFIPPFSVVAGLVPAIHVAPFPATPRVSGRSKTWMDKPGHDDFGVVVFTQRASAYRCDFKESLV